MTDKKKIVIIFSVVFLVLLLWIFLFFLDMDRSEPSYTYTPSTKHNDTLVVVADIDYAPYVYPDENGMPTGHDIELIAILAERLGKSLDIRLKPWGECIADMENGEADLILSYIDKNVPEIATSIPTNSDDFVLFGKSSYETLGDLYNVKIAYLSGSASDEIIKTHQLTANATKYTTYADAFASVERGENDYILASYAAGRIHTKDYAGITAQGTSLKSNMFTIGVCSSRSDLLHALNEEIVNLKKDGTITEIDDKWLGRHVAIVSMSEFLSQYRFVIVVAFLLVCILFVVTINILDKKKQKALTFQLYTDALTRLYTKEKFIYEAKARMPSVMSEDYMIVVADIDNFKNINNTYGYEVGNQVLCAFAEELQRVLPENSLIARESDDLFLMLMPNIFNGKTICGKDFCDACLEKNLFSALGERFHLNLSRGIYIIKNPEENVEYMIDCAHLARLVGKPTYGSTQVLFTEEMRQDQLVRNRIVNTMETAIDNKELFVLLQPKYNLLTEKIIGAEALVRWKTSDGEMIYPNTFIPVFENNGFIAKIDLFVFEEVCRLFSEKNLPLDNISVNLSTVSAMHEKCVENYVAILEKYRLDPSKISIEFTETALSKNFSTIKERASAFKKAGISVAIDDFGSGESSLNRLKEMDVDVIKLDKQFINVGGLSTKGLAIIKNMINLCRELHLDVVSEGIESREQLEELKKLGCQVGQGYYFNPPLSVERFIEELNGKEHPIN